MVEGEETGWLTVLEKKGIHQAAEILDNYGMNSETDVSVLDRDDFCMLVSGGLKTLPAKKRAGVTVYVHVPRTRCLRR
jgi:hypothetical protein